MTLKSDGKFEEKVTCALKNDMRNLVNFYQSTRKCQNWDFGPFIQSRKCVSLKFTEEIYVMTMKNDTKIEKELTFVILKLAWAIWRILTQVLENLKNFLFIWLLWRKYIMFELKKYRGLMFASIWFQKWHEEFGKFHRLK